MSFDFWNDDTEEASSGKYDSGSNDFEVIPKGTKVLFAIDEVKVEETEKETYINTRWVVMQPEQYKNRKVFHKIRLWDADQKKAEKAGKLIKAIDANAGGKLRTYGRSPDEWNDDLLSRALLNKPMLGTLGVWELQDKSASGNWIMAVEPKGKVDAPTQKAKGKPVVDEDDDIPF